MSGKADLSVTYSCTTSPPNLEARFAAMAADVTKEQAKLFKSLKDIGVKAAQAKAPVRSERLKRSLKKDSSSDANGFIVRSALSYAPIQDNAKKWGIKPAWPNVVSLRKWVNAVLKPTDLELDSVTYLVGRKLSKTTPKPHNFLQAAADAVQSKMVTYSDKMAKNLVAKVGGIRS